MISDRQNKECRSVDQTGKRRACVILIQSGTVQINSIDYVLIQYIPIQQIILRRKLCGHGSDKQTRGLRISLFESTIRTTMNCGLDSNSKVKLRLDFTRFTRFTQI